MSVLIGAETRVVIQGITGRRGRRAASDLLGYGTKVVAGVAPGHGGEIVAGVLTYDFMTPWQIPARTHRSS
jgi:succinyl-CoA synthetase alpha subunit